ncbi:MAG: ArnT family glycosyltransferase [Aurantibacter sp.]
MKKDSSLALYLCISVVVLVVLRFILIGALPLMDKTEARYAEIARLMVETGNWLVPQIDYGIPFWAKPPLSTWLAASSIKIFGVNELAVRLPSFLLHLSILAGLGLWLRLKKLSPYLLAFILLTTPEFILHMGVVSTDTVLGVCVVLVMLSFWEATKKNPEPFWKYLFFIALGLGLLAKGPIVLILTLPPILGWIALHRINLFEQLKKLQWRPGLILMAIIASPWYILAELQSPGFLDYFLVGEHFRRFVDPSWQGDMYGAPKRQPFGTIWLFLLIFAFPWAQFVLIKAWRKRSAIFKERWPSFLLFWFLWTPLFFTFSKNILHTYILPSMVPMALLVLYYLKESTEIKKTVALGSLFPAMILVATLIFLTYDDAKDYLNTDKYLLSKIRTSSFQKRIQLVYWKRKSYSGQFYSGHQLKLIRGAPDLDSILSFEKQVFVVVANSMRTEFSAKYASRLRLVDSNLKTSLYLLSKENYISQRGGTSVNILH